jgi:3-oxoacyl-[acyl-carrier protein] reductase
MLENKHILIIGAHSDIGLDNAKCFMKSGAKLHLSARTSEKIERIKSIIGTNHGYYENNFDCPESIEQFARSVKSKIDGVVFALGHTKIIPARMVNPDNMDQVLFVNFKLPVLLTKSLLKQKVISDKASLIYYTSVSYNKQFFGNSIYSSAKIALSNYVKSLATELIHTNIRVNSVAPGFVKTRGTENIDEAYIKRMEKHYPRGFTKPENVSQTVKFLLSDAATGIHGQEIIVDNGYSISL